MLQKITKSGNATGMLPCSPEVAHSVQLTR